MAKASAVLVVAAALLLSGSAVAARSDTSWDVSVKRGDGNEVTVTVTNKGPSPTVVQGGTSGFSLAMDCTCGNSKFSVVETDEAPVTATPGWHCSGGHYDVLWCYRKGAFGVGQTMEATFETANCYPGGHAFDLNYFTSDQGSLNGHIFHGNFSGPAGSCTEPRNLHVGTVRIEISARLKRLAQELRPQVISLLEEKKSVGDRLPDLRARAQKASAAVEPSDKGLGLELVAE